MSIIKKYNTKKMFSLYSYTTECLLHDYLRRIEVADNAYSLHCLRLYWFCVRPLYTCLLLVSIAEASLMPHWITQNLILMKIKKYLVTMKYRLLEIDFI